MKYLLFLICLALPTYIIRFNVFGIPTTLLEVLIYIVFIYGLFQFKKTPHKIIGKKILFPIGLLLIAVILSTYISPLKTVALGQAKAYFIDPLLVFYLIITFIKKEDILWIYSGLIGSGLIVSTYSIYQKIIGNVTINDRVIGIFGYSPNYVALFLVPIIILIAILNFKFLIINKFSNNNFQFQKYKLPIKIVLISSFIINIYALYLTGSRGGELAVLGGIIFYLVVNYWKKITSNKSYKILLIAFAIITLITLFWMFRPNFNMGDGRVASSSNVRVQIWQTSFEMIKKSPVFGVGLGNFQNAFGELTQNRPNFPEYITPEALTPHNIFLMFYLTTGLLGLIAFLWLIINFFIIGLNNRSSNSPMLLAMMVAMLIHGLVDAAYFSNTGAIIFWVLIGLIYCENGYEKK